ncbi:hypothetical protein FRC01_011244 [Tulasnella sp. 417]|nr:hypothetical protein FRC01_011244 [Tulasnella sp. 417]
MSSYDMDALIAGFSSSAHISQEANDLAALQAQLSSSLMMMPGSSRGPVASRACPTTPTMGTMDLAQYPPSATPSPQPNVHHSFHSASQSHSEDWTQDMMDEEMIEQSLLGLDDATPAHQPQSSLGLQNHYAHINHTPVGPTSQFYGSAEDNSFSSYAAMDPFFAAQLQAQLQQQQQQQQQQQYFSGFAPARGFGARQSPSSGAFGSRF